MERRFILHILSPLKNVSPFDANMAVDAGWEVLLPYTGVDLGEVAGLVQDSIFSRDPGSAKRTGIFIGGRDPLLALDMLEAAKAAMVPPFQVSVLADPAGAFTTAAGMIAVAERELRRRGQALAGRQVQVYGATGPVGGIAGVIAAKAGAKVTLVGYDGPARVEARAKAFKERFGVEVGFTDGSDDVRKAALMADAEVVLAAARTGVQVLSGEQIGKAKQLRVALDINAVPPPGIEGIDAFADGKEIAGTPGVGIGALAIGNVKFKTEHDLLEAMRDADKPLYIDFERAFEVARGHAA